MPTKFESSLQKSNNFGIGQVVTCTNIPKCSENPPQEKDGGSPDATRENSDKIREHLTEIQTCKNLFHSVSLQNLAKHCKNGANVFQSMLTILQKSGMIRGQFLEFVKVGQTLSNDAFIDFTATFGSNTTENKSAKGSNNRASEGCPDAAHEEHVLDGRLHRSQPRSRMIC